MYRSLSVGIIAGGKSTRMGEDKILLRLDDETMLERLVREFAPLSPVVSASAQGLPFDPGIPVVCDENEEIGPIEGIRRILATSVTDDVFCCAADMPFLTLDAALCLAKFRSPDHDCWLFTENGRLQPLCGIYSRSALPAAEEVVSEGRYAIRAMLDRIRTKLIPIEQTDLDPLIFRNINTREDYLESAHCYRSSGQKPASRNYP